MLRPRTPPSPRAASLVGGGAAAASAEAAATKYSAATTAISAPAPAIFTISGPSSANPRANAAFSVSVKIPFAASSCLRRDELGIIAASAGREERR